MNGNHTDSNWKQFKGNFCAAVAACRPAFTSTSTFIFTSSIATPGRRSSMLPANRHSIARRLP
jgi:hypothetical protein